jgi:hypothetical protein
MYLQNEADMTRFLLQEGMDGVRLVPLERERPGPNFHKKIERLGGGSRFEWNPSASACTGPGSTSVNFSKRFQGKKKRPLYEIESPLGVEHAYTEAEKDEKVEKVKKRLKDMKKAAEKGKQIDEGMDFVYDTSRDVKDMVRVKAIRDMAEVKQLEDILKRMETRGVELIPSFSQGRKKEDSDGKPRRSNPIRHSTWPVNISSNPCTKLLKK